MAESATLGLSKTENVETKYSSLLFQLLFSFFAPSDQSQSLQVEIKPDKADRQ